jgi:hypothetical protein
MRDFFQGNGIKAASVHSGLTSDPRAQSRGPLSARSTSSTKDSMFFSPNVCSAPRTPRDPRGLSVLAWSAETRWSAIASTLTLACAALRAS